VLGGLFSLRGDGLERERLDEAFLAGPCAILPAAAAAFQRSAGAHSAEMSGGDRVTQAAFACREAVLAARRGGAAAPPQELALALPFAYKDVETARLLVERYKGAVHELSRVRLPLVAPAAPASPPAAMDGSAADADVAGPAPPPRPPRVATPVLEYLALPEVAPARAWMAASEAYYVALEQAKQLANMRRLGLPQAIEVLGAGLEAANGIYAVNLDLGPVDGAPVWTLATDPKAPFHVYRCVMEGGARNWFISQSPAGKQPGTRDDEDMYMARAKAVVMAQRAVRGQPVLLRTPPQHGWQHCEPSYGAVPEVLLVEEEEPGLAQPSGGGNQLSGGSGGGGSGNQGSTSPLHRGRGDFSDGSENIGEEDTDDDLDDLDDDDDDDDYDNDKIYSSYTGLGPGGGTY